MGQKINRDNYHYYVIGVMVALFLILSLYSKALYIFLFKKEKFIY